MIRSPLYQARPTLMPRQSPVECPHCNSTETKKFGTVGKRQRYRCDNCGKQFIPAAIKQNPNLMSRGRKRSTEPTKTETINFRVTPLVAARIEAQRLPGEENSTLYTRVILAGLQTLEESADADAADSLSS